MKIRMMSDLHLEFSKYKVEAMPEDKDTVLVLAGDIHVGLSARNFMEGLADRFRAVIYVPGNHEYYHNEIFELRDRFKDAHYHGIDNVKYLDNRVCEIDDVVFIGSTMWTDYNREDYVAMARAKLVMSDYRITTYRNRDFTPRDSVELHKEARKFLTDTLPYIPRNQKKVVVTHHLPTYNVVHAKFRGDILNAAYAANADDLVGFADVWIHGHTHESHDIMCGDCRVICNPRGYYPQDPNANFDPQKIIEV